MTFTRLEVECLPEYTEILIAELAEAGFGMFMETETGFEADAEAPAVDATMIEDIRERYAKVTSLAFRISDIKKENWNEEWEKNVSPVIVEEECLIRAEFHKVPGTFPYEIIITPKMSFGTGHHPTTHLMVKSQLSIDHTDKLVMDAGCGTAILSVMACKRGAKFVEAFDIDSWSIENGRENAALNQCTNIRIRQGTITDFSWPEPFDLILANINRNILIKEMAEYARHLAFRGILQLSGFYVKDIPDLLDVASQHGLDFVAKDDREQWATLRLVKSN